ncbi:MAG: activator of photopigment and puc with BLUF domain protein [Alphaproteobacteria bacterium HGW-Alphaproteobacteria-15]|nr:MAG: activator of photopigment and puc with BLUF domain protein [Alphaproteobacteria bacterium HGW-Alphaproteobacteria-15]
MLQFIYVSSATPGQDISVSDILEVSRHNNSRDGITGLLYADARRFLQALEGPTDQVRAAMARIKSDPRHRAVVILSQREITTREFGNWAMAHRQAGDDSDDILARVRSLVASAAPSVRATFEGFCELRRTG